MDSLFEVKKKLISRLKILQASIKSLTDATCTCIYKQLTLFFIAALTIPVKNISFLMSTEHASVFS